MKLLLAAVLALPCTLAAAEEVSVGVFAIAPFVVAGPQGPHGLLIDFFNKEIAPRMGVHFNWSAPVGVTRLEQNLIHGAVMFTPLLAKSPERLQAQIIYAGDADIRLEPCLAMRPDTQLTAISSPSDLEGMTIGWVQSGALPDFLRRSKVKFDLVSAVNWEETNLNKLKAGRIDGAFFSDAYTARYFGMRSGANFRILALPAEGVPVFAAFSPQASPALVQRYEKAAREAFAKGRWKAYLEKALAVHGG
ncbi:MAG: transporter substrate-binding domain-containing protein [Pseudomonadota bacterium]